MFRRVTQQVLEYLHTPHDLPLAPNHQLLLAQAKTKDKDLEEGTPDHPGEPLETADVSGAASEPAAGKASVARAPSPATAGSDGQVVQAAMRQNELDYATAPIKLSRQNAVSADDPAASDENCNHWNRCPGH